MSTIIKPTIGRVVWFWPMEDADSMEVIDGEQPMAAIIAYVHADDSITIGGVDHYGRHYSAEQVKLVQDGEQPPRHAPLHLGAIPDRPSLQGHMNRRGFLGLLLGIAAAPLVARLPTREIALAHELCPLRIESIPIMGDFVRVTGLLMTVRHTAAELLDPPQPSRGGISRHGNQVLDFTAMPGGLIHWSAPYWGELFATREQPLDLIVPLNGSLSVSFIDGHGAQHMWCDGLLRSMHKFQADLLSFGGELP